MGQMVVKAGAKEASIQATVLRCTCGTPDSHLGTPCPQASAEYLGTISYYHRNPIKRWLGNRRIRKAGR